MRREAGDKFEILLYFNPLEKCGTDGRKDGRPLCHTFARRMNGE
jgi:hypothetical protein